MCGIAVALGVGGRPVPQAVVERMASSLVHRGPDDHGLYMDGAVGMGFRRLSILDLSQAGHQPMVSEDGQLILVFNGEIFNYLELRGELERLGHRFRSSGDSEVLLAAYRQWGRGCLSRLNGMWAFVIYDRRERRLFGSRDRFGVKPLFYYRGEQTILFASEIKAIRASGCYSSAINWSVAARFFLSSSWIHNVTRFTRVFTKFPLGVALRSTWKDPGINGCSGRSTICRLPSAETRPQSSRIFLRILCAFACVVTYQSGCSCPVA